MSNSSEMSPGIKYFMRSLERRSDTLKSIKSRSAARFQDVDFEEVEQFFRTIKAQNIFISTVGVNGKAEATILSKAIFNLNKVVSVFYSISLDESQSGYLRIRPDIELQTILVESMHGLRPKPTVLYQSPNQLNIIRFMTRWMLKRIDWRMTKIDNLDLYKRFVEVRREEMEAKIEAQIIEEGLGPNQT